jgi:glycosyltransferase involved in cell wall biosynthesis
LAANKDAACALRNALRQAETRLATLLHDTEQRERSAIADRQAMLAVLRTRIDDLDEQLRCRAEELAAAREHLSRVYSSTCWRVSRPIRMLAILRGRRPQAFLRHAARLVYWTVTLQVASRLREWRMVRLVYASGNFDHDYYINRYEDVAISGLEPALHYIQIGAAEGRDPSSRFVTEVYRARHPDLPLSQNPLIDAIRNRRVEDGCLQGPLPAPWPVAGAEPVDPLAGIRSLTFHPPAVSAMTIVVDARTAPVTVERILRTLAACQDERALDLIMLVGAEADPEIVGIGRIVAGADDAFWHFDTAVLRSRASHIAVLQAGTEIDGEALAAGLATATGSADIGALCAARVGPDGTLIDAGLRLDPDGSLQPRGAGLAPNDHRVASVSEVDVLAPGLVIVSRQAWQAVGGFGRAYYDPRYAAADFSVRARAAGYRILCQPFMRVSSPDTPQQQPILAADSERLLRKQADSIEQMKRDRRPFVLFVDHSIPTPDRDAGSEFICWTMRIFLGLGYRVAFLPVTTLDVTESYTHDLRRLGIEVVSGPAMPPADTFIRANAAAYQLIILYRAPIAHRHIDDIRRVAPYTRVVFNTVDLHFLREERQAALHGSADDMERAKETKRIELASIRKADCTIILSEAERDILSGLVGSAALQFVPLISPAPGSESGFETRRNIVFVGGFGHLPNVDAVRYFASAIWPLVHARLPDAQFIIVGSNAPDAVRDLAAPALGIEMRGFVSDLRALLGTCRLTVAPLRYGAGMKGKVVTSLAHGVPCIASPIAVEGSGLVPGDGILIEADPAGFAEAVIAAYEDRPLWEQLSASAVRFAAANFSVARATELLQEMLRSLNLPG